MDGLTCIKNGQHEKYIILPNNKNIILAAQQLKKMKGEEVHIVPTTNPMEGLAAAMAFSADETIEKNLKTMESRMNEISTGMITNAVRDSVIGDTIIHENDFLAISKAAPIIPCSELRECVTSLLAELISEESEIVTIYYGKDLSEEACHKEVEQLEEIYPDIEFDVYDGGQPLYPIFLSVE